MNQTPTVGRIVHFHPFPGSTPFAAMVVAVFNVGPDGTDMANLDVFTDGTNGKCDHRYGFTDAECAAGRAWRTSVHAQTAGQTEGAVWACPPRV